MNTTDDELQCMNRKIKILIEISIVDAFEKNIIGKQFWNSQKFVNEVAIVPIRYDTYSKKKVGMK